MHATKPRLANDRTQKRCWNCRDRKIACDRSLPSCSKCKERGDACRGYGLKLSWPKDNDGRRSARQSDHFLYPVQYKDLDFINTSAEDIEVFYNPVRLWQRPTSYDMSWLSHLPSLTIASTRSMHTTEAHMPVSLLVSSSADVDGLYGLLLRLSFYDDELPSLATRHALSALSYQHLDQHKAVLHQTKAIRALQSSIEAFPPSRALQTMAASMLLSIFETINFDSSALSWSIFFCGTKTIARGVTKTHDSYYGDRALLLDWIFYLDTMYKFSIRHWSDKNDDQINLAGQKKIISKPIFAPERQIIVSTLGCSLEMLDLVCQAVDAVLDRDDPLHLSVTHVKAIQSLEIRTQGIEQRSTGLDNDDDAEGMVSRTNTAELYRVATLIYLGRVARAEPRDSDVTKEPVAQAFTLLRNMTVCNCPWPLFVVGLEAHTEDQRKIVLTVLDASLRRRPMGSMVLTSRMIREAWALQDLQTEDTDPLALYGLVISHNRVPPSFT
ncbi:hypothetical protein CONLIGDRAFT_636998 [Coniochaeta ligniaria NRRL 30616]|uniref:Zn(2)-C6 fungal-type domain-containing protein n=1 Tax=Coniochaeta ligniaria NRRL 30616 TaxID=1408157 RepID=A0A1J7J3J8_9PEZI|nr:hypothetical protein CONLIGDRAFT_636998 [Coniochaeta ligniaria NRRL 30616]